MSQQTPHPTHSIDDQGGSGTGKIKFFDITPPIDGITLDVGELKKSFEEFKILPYAGSDKFSSHTLCQTLYQFRDLSTTYAGILNDFKSYGLGQKFKIKKIEDSIFDIEDEKPIGADQERKFNDFIKQNFIFHDCTLIELADFILRSEDSTGQVGIEIIKKTILGKTTITYKYHNPMDYVFLLTNRIGDEIAISKSWEAKYIKENPPLVIPLFPNWEKYKDGYERTFYFSKLGSELYGRPNDISCLPDKYNEWKLKQYLTKKNKKLWMPDVFIETQDSARGGFTNDQEAQNKGFRNSKHRIEYHFTNAGDNASSFMITNRANDAAPTFIHEFQGLKNSKEIMNYREMFKTAILEANGWPKLLLEMQGATGFSNNVFLDVFGIKEVTKISEIQLRISTIINDLIGIGYRALGSETEYGIDFKSPLTQLVNEYRNSKGGNIQQPGSEGIGGAKSAGM